VIREDLGQGQKKDMIAQHMVPAVWERPLNSVPSALGTELAKERVLAEWFKEKQNKNGGLSQRLEHLSKAYSFMYTFFFFFWFSPSFGVSVRYSSSYSVASACIGVSTNFNCTVVMLPANDLLEKPRSCNLTAYLLIARYQSDLLEKVIGTLLMVHSIQNIFVCKKRDRGGVSEVH
jgi:hypothetical protein